MIPIHVFLKCPMRKINLSMHLKDHGLRSPLTLIVLGGGEGLFGPCDANFSKSARVRTIITLPY